MRAFARTVCMAVCMFLVPGCVANGSQSSAEDEGSIWAQVPGVDHAGYGYSSQSTPLTVAEAAMHGDYGGVVVDRMVTATVTGVRELGYATIEVVTHEPQGAHMAVLEFLIDPATITPGTHGSWAWDDWDSPVVGLGCAGALPYSWNYDATADEVIMHVDVSDDDPNVLVYEFTAIFDPAACGYSCQGGERHAGSEKTELSGRFELRRN